MDERLEQETAGLIKSWQQHDEAFLRDYLIADVEDPRINVQSTLTRHFLIEALFGKRFAALMEQELRFATVMNWWLKLVKQSIGAEELQAIHHALNTGADNAEGLEIPHFVSRTFATLPAQVINVTIPNYFDDFSAGSVSSLQAAAARRHAEAWTPNHLVIAEDCISTFQLLWRNAFAQEWPQSISVLEPACGSANDYRFLDAFGIARLLKYTGFDLCEKNIRNAHAIFPSVCFEVGNAFEIHTADQSFDFCFAHDLLEHLSIPAMGLAVAEMCRVTRKALCVGFFNMDERAEHFVQATDDYHWNILSQARTKSLFERHGFSVQAIHIDTFLRQRFGCDETHNKNAYTFRIARVSD